MRLIASIPTMPSRMDVLEKAVRSIAPQVDTVYLYLNGFPKVPDFVAAIPNAIGILPAQDRGSASRFYVNERPDVSPDDMVLYCDDDLLYPADYVAVLIHGWTQHGGVVSFHGRKIRHGKRMEMWTPAHFEAIHPCLDAQIHDERVEICGTGVAMVRAGDFLPMTCEFKHPNYDDVEYAILAWRAGVKITCLAHAAGWIKYLKPSGPTIWEQTFAVHHRPLIDLVNESGIWMEGA